MFTGCLNLENLDLSSFNTKNAINIEGIFGEYENPLKFDKKVSFDEFIKQYSIKKKIQSILINIMVVKIEKQ